jgi:multiple sugar transport system substrate-binding protein
MKKAIYGFCMIFLVVPVFAGGGRQQSGESKTSLLVWLPPFGTGDTLDKDFWTKALNPWEIQNNAKVTVEIIPWAQMNEKYMTGFSSGTGADIAYEGIGGFSPYIEMGVCEPLEPYFTETEQDNYLHWNLGSIKGKQYILPFIVGNARVMFFNMDVVKKAGITTLPKTWNEFIEFGKKVTAAKLGPDILTFAQEWVGSEYAAAGIINNYLPYYWQAGGNMFSQDGTKVTLDQGDSAVRAAQFLYDLMYVHSITSKESFSLSESEKARLFTEGKIVCILAGASLASRAKAAGVNWDFVDTLTDKTGAIWVAADSLFMNSASKNKQVAASLMKFMSSPQVMEAFHKEIASFPPITKGEAYTDDARFQEMYETSKYLHTNTDTPIRTPVITNLFGNLQLMMLNEITPQEAIRRTVEYSKTITP